MSQFIINADGTIEQDKIFLCDRLLHKKGEIYPVDNLKIDAHLKSNWEVSFTIYKYNNGKEIQVNDGNTFIQIMPDNQTLAIS